MFNNKRTPLPCLCLPLPLPTTDEALIRQLSFFIHITVRDEISSYI
jgi:hypothetical protein